MSRSANSLPVQHEGKRLAVAAEALYVVNLLLLPVIAFAVLAWLFLTRRQHAAPLARAHLEQTVAASLWIAVMFIVIAGCLLLLQANALSQQSLWIIGVILFTIIHASMVLLGVIGLAKAMAGKCWRFPLFGRRLPEGCG